LVSLRSPLILSLSLAAAGSLAQQAPPPPPAPVSFAITGYRVLGNTLLNAPRIEQATRGHTGPNSSFETIQQALESLEAAYVAAGYGLVRIEIPEQELAGGVVTLQVIEGVVSSIELEPNAFFDADNVRRSLPALRQGQPVSIRALNRNLALANAGGSKVTNVTFKRNPANQEVQAQVKLAAEDPQRWMALLDNSGSDSTGQYRLGMVYQHANVLNRDHSLALQWLGSPDHLGDVYVLGLSYRVPLYALGDAIDFSASSSSVDSGQVSGAAGTPDLAISGSGLMLGLRYTRYLDATADLQHSLSLGLEHRAYGNSVTPLGGQDSLVPDLSTHPLTLSYQAQWKSEQRDVSAQLAWLANLPGGKNGRTEDFNQPGGRSGASASFQTWRLQLQHTERFASQWSLRSALSAQFSSDLLIAPEQFGAGGADSVRGFEEREVAGDQGLRASIEVWAPPISADTWRMIPLGFVDAASVKRNQPQPGEIGNQNISSLGVGLRAAWGRHLNLRMDWAYVLKGLDAQASGTAKSDQKVHATAAWTF